MKGIAILALVAVAGVALWKHQQTASRAGVHTQDQNLLPSGVSRYTPIRASQSNQQLLAGLATNPDSVVEPGYAPAFGDENQPSAGEMLI